MFPTHPTFLFPRLKIKKIVEIIEVIESESQAMLNALREYTFQVAFKK
jgi:hypothetical protein